ncbi:nesprin-1 isoform X4 [Trichomycterus rosablanca]
MELLDRFNQTLATLTQWSETFLAELRSKSKVAIADLTSVDTQNKDDEAAIQSQREAMDHLKKHLDTLGPILAPVDLQQIQARQDDCLQPFHEAQTVVQNRTEALAKLKTFLETYRSTSTSLQTLRKTVEERANWDQTVAGNLNQELAQLAQDFASVEIQAISVDSGLNKAYLHLHGIGQDRTSCRGLTDDLGSSLQQLQRSMGTRQSEAEALEAMWSSFTRRKELLLRSLAELEERVRKAWLQEPSVQNFQQRLRTLKQLEEELESLQHSQMWLGDRGEQLSHRESELVGEAQQDVTLVQSSWDTIKNLVSVEQEQCTVLLEICKEYQTLKSKLSSVVERAHGVTTAQFNQHNPEDSRRALTRLEVVKSELTAAHEELEKFISKGKRFITELKNLQEDATEQIRTEINVMVDQWMDISEKIDVDIDRLRVSLGLWSEMNSIANDIECWSATSVNELNEGPVHLLSSPDTESYLTQFKLELESKKEALRILRRKMTELQDVTNMQQAPVELQAMDADLRKKILHAEEVYEEARSVLRDFSSQNKQLQDVITQMAEQLDAIESALSELGQSSDPENVAKIREAQRTQKQVDSGLDVAGESLRALCRTYPAPQLTSLGESITDLVKRSEAAAQHSGQTLRTLQESLLQGFNELTQDFQHWFLELRAGTEGSPKPADVPEVTTRQQKFKVALEQVAEGEMRLVRLHEEAERILPYLSKTAAGGVQERLTSCHLALDGFAVTCRQNLRSLEESAALQNGFEGSVEELREWLRHIEERLQKEPDPWEENQPGVPDCSTQLSRMEELHKKLLMRRPSLDRLCQTSLPMSEGGSVLAELLSSHHALLQDVWARIRHLQEYQAFNEAGRAMRDWLEEVQSKLEKLDCTEGVKDEVEERLEQVQDILLMKGEGEVKLNMAAGKGELVIKSSGQAGQEVIRSKLQEVEDAWAALLLRAMSCHSRLEWTVSQWGLFVESRSQLKSWLEEVEAEVTGPLEPQLGLREKRKQLERLCLLSADVEDHQGALCYLEESAAELYKRTGDPTFREEETAGLRAQFDDVRAAAEERVRFSEGVVFEHEKYVATVRELTDWLMTKGEELQRCYDPTGDSASVQRKLLEVRELVAQGAREGRERLRRVRMCAESACRLTAAAGCELMDGEVLALARALQQWEGQALRARDTLETAVSVATGAEHERRRLAEQLEEEMERLERQLKEWSDGLKRSERRNSGAAAVEGWTVAKGVLEGLQTAEVMEEKLKTQLNELCGYSSDLGPQSERVSALIKLHNSLSLRAARECQNKEKLLEQRFRSSMRDFRQWLVNANISTAKCFDSPHSIQEVSAALQRIQEFLSDRQQGQTRLNAVLSHGEQLDAVVPADRVETVRAKTNAARDDWSNLMDNLQQRQTVLQALQGLMQEFEASVEPLQDWLNRTEITVQESSTRLHDLPAKRLELSKLQAVLEEMSSVEVKLGVLRERAHSLWEGQAAGKGFVHRVCQLAARYLALSNRTKEKVSRVERVVGEHQLYSQGLQELQSWLSEAQRVLETCRSPSADKSVLVTRMSQLEDLLTARQEREIQLKMLITRGEAVQRNTSAEGVPVVRKQIQDLKDSWDSLLSASIQCKSQLEGALSHWTSYQEDVSQFESWLERVDESLGNSDKLCTEMREKTANLRKAKLLYEEVLSHSSLLETIATKGSNMAEHLATQQEVHKLSERYEVTKDKAKAAVSKAEELVLVHQEYQRGLHMFEDWLEQEQSSLALLSPLDGDVNTLEKTLKELQVLQSLCSEGHALLNSALSSRERVIPWGVPQIEDRALETAQREWQAYQDRLENTRAGLEQTLTRLQQLEGCFQSLDQWLTDLELKVRPRSHRRSDSATKDVQLQRLLHWQVEAGQKQRDMEDLSALAQQVVEDAHVSARVSARVTQLTTRYHSLLLRIQETIRQLQEEIRTITEAQDSIRTFSDWLSAAQVGLKSASESKEALDRLTLDKKMKRLESLQSDLDHGHALLKTLCEKLVQAVCFLDEREARELEQEVQTRRSDLEELSLELRAEHGATERSTLLYKEFQERYKAQLQWLRETGALLNVSTEPKAELYQKKAQLAKLKAVEQALMSRDSAVSAVLEKGKTLLHHLYSPSITENLDRLQDEYKELCAAARTQVQKIEAHVKKQEAYHTELQEVERWLLQMSSRMVTPDPAPGGGLEAATQQLARHKAIMEEIAGFEERLSGLKDRAEKLTSGCTERFRARLRQQTQNHLQGARDSYSAICSTAQRVYQSLDRELQRHVSLRDALQQCQNWLFNIQDELQPVVHTPRCLEEALTQLKQERTLQEQASTYLQLMFSTCDLSDEKVQETAADIQQVKIQAEERTLEFQDLTDSWREIENLHTDLESRLREAEQFLQNMLRRPAELEPKVCQNQLDQAQDFILEIQARQVDITQLRERVGKLVDAKESPELVEVGRLRRSWLELAKQAAELLEQREEDLQRSGDYQECLSMAEELFDQLSKEWNYLSRGDMESTEGFLDALKKLSIDLQDQRCVLDDLKDNRNAVLPRLGLDDKDLVKEQVGYLEQRWTQIETQVEQKTQDTIRTLEDLSHLEDQLRDTKEWAEVQRPSISEVFKTSPPPDLAQSFLFDHLSFCAELEAKQQLVSQSLSEADSLYGHLGLLEKKNLQALVHEVQIEIESLGANAARHRKSLSKVFTERTQFLQALDRASAWIKQQEQKVLADEHVALLPDELSKQVFTCRNVCGSLRAYQVEMTSLWTQGRELVKDTTEEEKTETLQRLEELQGTFEASLQRCVQHLQRLEKALATRKYFKVDLDRMCEWLRHAETSTFPVIDLSLSDEELQNQFAKYQQLLDHTSAYENLLLIVQRGGQEILPTLNEVDHCYLDERLNGLPQQYNAILLSTKEKRDRIQRVILERREFESLAEATRKALEELQEQCDALENQTTTKDLKALHSDYLEIQKCLLKLLKALKELRNKTQDFHSTGQPYTPAVINQLFILHTRLNIVIKEKVKELNSTLNVLNDYSATLAKTDSGMSAIKEDLQKLYSQKQLNAIERLSQLHKLAKDLNQISSLSEGLTGQIQELGQHLEPQVSSRQTQLQALETQILTSIQEGQSRAEGMRDLSTELKENLEWLRKVRDDLTGPVTLREVDARVVQEEIRSTLAVQEEMKSRIQALEVLRRNERQEYDRGPVSGHIETGLKEMAELETELQQAFTAKQETLQSALSVLQKYQSALRSTCQWLNDSESLLKQTNKELDPENLAVTLTDIESVITQKQTQDKDIQGMGSLFPQMEEFIDAGVFKEVKKEFEATCQKSSDLMEQLLQHQESLNRYSAHWTSFQRDRDDVITEMTRVEKRLAAFGTANSSSLQETEDKLQTHQIVIFEVEALQDKLTNLKDQTAELDNGVYSAAASRSVCALCRRWTHINSVARAQEKALRDAVQDWRRFMEKLVKMRSVWEDLHGRVPDGVVEKAASTVALHNLLEYHDSFSREVERESSALTLLRHHALGLLLRPNNAGLLPPSQQPATPRNHMDKPTSLPITPTKLATTSSDRSDTPGNRSATPGNQMNKPSNAEAACLQGIQAMQEKYDSLLQRVSVSRQQVQVELLEREEVERELGLVKGWIQDTQGLLLSPTADLETLLSDLETAHGGVQSQRQALEQIADRQQTKYKDLRAAVPSEISTQLAQVTLALGSAEDQVQSREKEVQHSRDVKEDFNSRLKDVSERVNAIAVRLKQKSVDVEEAKEETEMLREELKDCSHTLSELDVAVQEFGEQNPLLARQLGATLSKLTEFHSQTSRVADGRTARLKKAEQHFEEFNEKLTLILNWTEKAETLVSTNIVWSPASMMQEQIRTHQALLREWRRLQGEVEALTERVGLLGEVVHTEALTQQVSVLSHHAEELQQRARTRLLSLQDAAKDLSRLECEVKNLHHSVERVQETLGSPDLARLSLREQLLQRQHLLTEMEGFKVQIQAVQKCMSALQLPVDVVATLPLCVTAQNLQQDSSHLQHTTIQQCNILQEATVQYEQYEQEVKNLQKLIEEAQRVIQDRPVATSNIQELQTQIQHHEELAEKIKGYQEQIATLNCKCKMLTVKAKHATMLLTVSDVAGLSDSLDELEDEEEEMAKHPATHPSVVMMTAGRCHTLLSPVTEESGEDGTNSEVSSPPACRSPSPGPNADASLNQVPGRAPLSRAPLQELYDQSIESANLDDLQRSWETLKNVISEKQKSLYEALERQQHYQESLQSVSTKMESIESALSEGLEPGKSPESQMAAHQALMDEILMLQDEISALQACFSEELRRDEESPEQDAGDQLALHSTLTVLGERMATIHMKASGKRQLLEERLNEQLEEQRQEQALQRYHTEAEELDHWLLSTRATLNSALRPHQEDMDMEDQLTDCQNMLLEIEQKVVCLSELSVHSESLLMEGKAGTRGDAEQLTHKLHVLKASLLELQRILQDKHTHIQGTLLEQEESEPDSTLSQSPSMLDWLSQARSTRTQQHQDTVQRQRELEAQLEEQRKLMQSVACRGEELLSQQTTPNGESAVDLKDLLEQSESAQDLMTVRWENLNKDLNTKMQLLLNTMQEDQLSSVFQRSRVSSPGSLFRGDQLTPDVSFPSTVFETFNQGLEGLAKTAGGADGKQDQTQESALYEAVCAASSWLDGAENSLLLGPVLLSEDSEVQLCHLEGLNKEVKNVFNEVCKCREVLAGGAEKVRDREGHDWNQFVIEEVLDGLEERLRLMDSLMEQRCDSIRDRVQEHSTFQTELRLLFSTMSDAKHQLLKKLSGSVDRPASKQMETLAEAEDGLREFEQKVSEMRTKGETLQPDSVTTPELLKLQDVYEELVEIVGSRRSGLNQTLVLKTQYEKALHDLQELVDTAQDKMAADQKMTVGSVLEVQILLDKHKEFFQGLESHVVLTQAFFKQVSVVMVQREAQTLEQTVAQAQTVLKQAHRRGVELEGILESWSRLVGDYQALYNQLEMVESSIPTVGLVEETEERLTERITLYQVLKSTLVEGQPQLYQVLEDGKRLLLSVCCSELEAQLTQLGDHWLSSTTKISRELQRLDSTLKHSTRYQRDSAELGQWLSSALDRLEFWSTQSVTVPQELETVRDHLHAFLEFSKEVDARSSLRSSVLSRGNQLLRLKKVDTAALRTQLAQVETQWADLLTHIPVVQEKLHQLQMEKLPSRHAITELMSWISLMENVIQEDQNKIGEAVGSEVVQSYIQKYKGFQIDLSCKQLTVDFVNQSVLQISSQDVEGKRGDKTDFAERLGVMNRRWQILQGLITEKIRVLEGLLESWLEYENGVQNLRTWIGTQEEKLKKKPMIEDVASVLNLLKDCQELEELVKEKEKELEKVEEKGCLLVRGKKGEASSSVMEVLKGLNQSWANLDQMIGQVKVSLRAVLEQWSLYKRAYEEIHGYLMEGRYSISRLRLLTGSPEAVLNQVENLENLLEELEKQESSLKKFASLTEQLLKDCHSSVSDSLNTTLTDINLRWNSLLEQISDRLSSSKSLLQLWRRYKELQESGGGDVQRLEERAERLRKSATRKEITEEEVKAWICDANDLLKDHGSVQDALQRLTEVEEQLRMQVEPSAMATFHTDFLSLGHRLTTLGTSLNRQQALLEVSLKDYENFREQLNSLSRWPKEAETVLQELDLDPSADLSVVLARMEKLKAQMLNLSHLSPDLERVNNTGYRLPLNDQEIKSLQNLNRSWNSTSAHTTERFSKLQAVVLHRQSFLEKCETWLNFLTQTEEKLAAEISGNYQSLLEQQREHELFQTEMFSRQQILYSIISDGHQLLNQGRVEDRDDFGLKLALLGNQWQGVVRRAQQRRGIIDALVCQWQRYTEMAEKLRHWLREVALEPQERQGELVATLQQARGILDHIQLKERVLQRQQGSYILAVEAGRQLLLSADAQAEALLQDELTDLQERWRSTSIHLDQRKKELLSLLKDWEQCEKGIGASHEKLRAFKRKLSLPLPDHHEELHNEQIRCKELEGSTEGWSNDVAALCALRDSLSSSLSSDDLTVLQERLELLQRQWEETCHQLTLRRQQVSEKLNEWAVFNEKNKELCEWLTHMESKVSQNGDVSIEDMIEKLKKDYQEEISVVRENKQQLELMGERLAQASHENKAAEIQYKLSKVNERWQHLLDLRAARVKKLKETMVAVQQLDKNMSSLRSWLSHIETELAQPIVYETCDAGEIQKKLSQQQDLQRDIEKHSTGVASVLNLCEVLLHDCDASATETQCDSIQQATRGLDRRWRNICALAMERRLKLEETWRLWQKFLDDYSHFEDWLKASERTAALPNSSGVLYTVAKEELKKFEAFQRQVQEFLTQLELINKQYRRLARENRTDSSCRLRQMVHDGNRRWDTLQRRVAAILRRLKHFIGQREEFETVRDSILVWLTEMDLQLTNIEHFSECDVQAKIKQLKAFQQEIELNTGKIGSVFSLGEALMEKSEPLDAAVIEEELDELQRYCREVFGRVDRYYRKLTRLPLADEECDGSDQEFELDNSGDFSDLQWEDGNSLPDANSRPPSASPAPLRANCSGRDTPGSVDSIPLEWDHDYDLEPVAHSVASKKRGQGVKEEEVVCVATSALKDVVIPESPEAYIKLTENTLRSSNGEAAPNVSDFDSHNSSYVGYMRLMGDCRGSLNAVRRAEGELEQDENDLSGLSNPDNPETQNTGVIERWELIQAQSHNLDNTQREDLLLWHQLTSDLEEMEAWLCRTEEELAELRGRNLSTDINTIDQRIQKLKELQKSVDTYKAKILSLNLSSVGLLQSDSDESRKLRKRLKEINSRWDQLGKSLQQWRASLQDALLQCQEFHELSHGLLLWLENIDRRRNDIVPITPGLERHTLQAHYRALEQIQQELRDSERSVNSLQELSVQLLVQAQGGESLEAQERVHVISNRLRLLLKAVTSDLELLEKELQASGDAQVSSVWSPDDVDTSGSASPVSVVNVPVQHPALRNKCNVSEAGSSAGLQHHRSPGDSACASSRSGSSGPRGGAAAARCQPFLLRVLRAALPLQLLLLLVVGLACLVPMTEEDYSCAHANNFARSFHPMLRYTNGPPPF